MDKLEAKAESKYQPRQDVVGQYVAQMRKHGRGGSLSSAKVRQNAQKVAGKQIIFLVSLFTFHFLLYLCSRKR